MADSSDIVVAYRTGRFLQAVYDRFLNAGGETSHLSGELVILHNDGQIDVVAGFRGLRNVSAGPDFFLTRDIFEKALPHIKAPVISVMECVRHLALEAGQGGTASTPFIDFCAADPTRPKESLEHIEKSIEQLVDFLVPSIVAGSRIDSEYFLNEAIRLSEHGSIEIRRRAIYSLGRIQVQPVSSLLERALGCLEKSLRNETDDQLLGDIIQSSFDLYKLDNATLDRTLELIRSALSQGGEYALHAGSGLLRFNTSELPVELLDSLLEHLATIKPANKRAMNNLDGGLAKLLTGEDSEKAIRFLETFLVANHGDLSLEVFDSVIGKLYRNPQIINRLLTKWLLSGNRVLCEGISAIVNNAGGHDMMLSIAPSEMRDRKDELAIIFLARKAIGYLFSKPVTAASIIISLIRHSVESETVRALTNLLFDPLLINYPGQMTEYLREQKASDCDNVNAAAETTLNAFDDYITDLNSAGEIPELHPSQAQREAHARYFSRTTSESMKGVRSASVFLSLVSKSVLLYGRKSIAYIDERDDAEPNRMEIPLKLHRVSVELPRLLQIDPFDLEYMLRIFRAERMKP